MAKSYFDWLMDREAKAHKVFGSEWNCDLFLATIMKCGEDRLRYLGNQFNLRVGALPIGDFSEKNFEKAVYPGWKIKPYSQYYLDALLNNVHVRKHWGKDWEKESLALVKKPYLLKGDIVLFDTRPIPSRENGSVSWERDRNYLGSLLTELRVRKAVRGFSPIGSRFGVTSKEWDKVVRPALAEKLGFGPSQVRLEKVIEFVLLSQLYKDTKRFQKDFGAKTSILLEEFPYFTGDHRYCSFGMARKDEVKVIQVYSYKRNDLVSFRPLIVLAKGE